ncbi:MAG: fibronectin type III domain-containing protein [Clostridiales bacterium]|jgi:hypothetical protein|nr:fibronectin type III domain-containing protein [Eubacteriales bacterium]MDH7567014.1 fibronectin type III domain-containing protein [Clostridiales bacterium]
MKLHIRIYSILAAFAVAVQALFPAAAWPAGTYTIPRPENFDVKMVNGQYNIVYDKNEFKHKVTLKWTQTDDSANQANDISDYGPIVQKGYRVYTSTNNVNFNLYPQDISWGSTGEEISLNLDSDGINPLKSGTIYYARVQAFHRHIDPASGKETVHESVYATTMFMTAIDVAVVPLGTDQIEIDWDDVKYNGKRIDYDIDISESKDFATYQTYSVREQNISSSGPVIPVPGTAGGNGKLKFVVKGSDFGTRPGTIYYVRVKPKNVVSQIRYRPESDTAVGYTNIIATMVRLSQEWWRIDWNPITESSLGSGQTVRYSIKRGILSQPNLPPVTIASDIIDSKYPVNVTGGDYYYIVVAEVKDQFGNDIPDGIQSAWLKAVEEETPSRPPVPDLRDEIRKYYPDGDILYSYTDSENLKPDEVTVAWMTPKLSDGTTDTGTLYDIWLLTNPADIDNDNVPKVKEDYSVGSDSASKYLEIVAGDKAVSEYTFTGLSPNTTYYLKIKAKKYFTVNENGSLVNKAFESEPALKVIVTPSGGPINQPEASARPPLKIKTIDPGNKEDVDKNSVRIQWYNDWWEHWDSNTQKWSVTEAVYQPGDPNFRHIVYDSGVTFRVGYVQYQDGMDYETIKDLPTLSEVIPNDVSKVTQEYNLQGLEPNTTYVVWLKAVRTVEQGVDLVSEPSDPIIVVTKPEITEPVEKPTVPNFYYSLAGDTYVDLQWNVVQGYTYYIKYSTTDDIQTAQNTITVTPSELLQSTVCRIKGLSQNTTYYFWIQADSAGKNMEEGLSLWSDSYLVKTSPYLAPDAPTGFGVKNTEDAVQKNSITFEWVQVDGLEYILELASDINFQDLKEYKAGAVGEFKVEGLKSNFRYYARLYAYDPAKQLKSLPTQVITVRTAKSGDDYDSDENTENVLTGPFVTESFSNGIWSFKVTGANAVRLIQKVQSDSALDYTFDLSQPPANTTQKVITVSDSVFRALSNLKENIIIDSGYVKCTIRPDVFNTEQVRKLQKDSGDFDIQITITDDSKVGSSPQTGLKYKTKTTNILISAVNGGETVRIGSLNRPLKLSFLYTEENFFKNDVAAGFSYDPDSGKWVEHKLEAYYDGTLKKGYASFDVDTPGRAAVMAKTGDYADIYDDGARSQIMSIASRYNLKSVDASSFRPLDNMTLEEAVKIMMDILGYDYGSDYGTVAVKAGFISPSRMEQMETDCTKKELLQMIDKLQKRLTGSEAPARDFTSEDDGPVTRGEAMVELYTMLKDIGEI